MRRQRTFWFGVALVAVFAIGAVLSFFWTPYDIGGVDIPNRMKPPSAQHFLGTDHFGRDILSMIMIGARTSIAVAFVAVASVSG